MKHSTKCHPRLVPPPTGATAAAQSALEIIQQLKQKCREDEAAALDQVEDSLTYLTDYLSLDQVEDSLTYLTDYLSLDRGSKPWTIALSFGLTAKEAHVFDLLYKRGDHGTSREALYAALYGNDASGGPKEKILDVLVSHLRRKLHDAAVPYFIETIWGRGYRMIADPDNEMARKFLAKPKGGRWPSQTTKARAERFKKDKAA